MTLAWALACADCTDGTGAGSAVDGSVSQDAGSEDAGADGRGVGPVDAGADPDAPGEMRPALDRIPDGGFDGQAHDAGGQSPSCPSGVACTDASCGQPAGGALCGDAQCGAGSVCVTIYSGTPSPEAGPPSFCRLAPAACANDATCDCLGPALCLGDNNGYSCVNDEAGCSQHVECSND